MSLNKYLGIGISLMFLLLGCSNSTEQASEKNVSFKYGIVQTSNLTRESEIVLFSSDWKIKKKIFINAGGLAGRFRKFKKYKHKLYIPVMGVPSAPDNRILELDLNNLNIKYFRVRDLPITLDLNDKFLYVTHNSALNYGILSKIDIEKNKIVKEIKLEGLLTEVALANNRIYVMAEDPPSGRQTIYELDESLEQKRVIENKYTAYATDSTIDDNKLLIANISDANKAGPAGAYTQLDLDTRQLSYINLPEVSPSQIFNLGNKLMITHYFFPRSTGNFVTVIDKKSNNKKVFALENKLIQSSVEGNRFYSLGKALTERGISRRIYEYDLDSFKLLHVQEIAINNNMVISLFFIK